MPIERRRRPTWTGRGSRLCARAWRWRPPARPSIRTSAASPSCATCPTVVMECPRSLRAVTGPDAPQPFDRKRMEELQLAVGRHQQQAVGLRDTAGHLREELRPRDTHRDRHADLLEDIPSQSDRDLHGRARDPPQSTDVEERLVDRQPFDERRRVVEHLEQRLARLGVGIHPRAHDDRLRAQPESLRSAHRRGDPERLRLVAGRQHDTGPHDDGTAAQAGVVSLLDRRVERVDVCVQDRRLVRHEHMFASVGDARAGDGSSQPLSEVCRRVSDRCPARHVRTENRRWVALGVSIDLVFLSSIPAASRSFEQAHAVPQRDRGPRQGALARLGLGDEDHPASSSRSSAVTLLITLPSKDALQGPYGRSLRGVEDVRRSPRRPRQDSNLRPRLRRPVLYPLSYGGSGAEV